MQEPLCGHLYGRFSTQKREHASVIHWMLEICILGRPKIIRPISIFRHLIFFYVIHLEGDPLK